MDHNRILQLTDAYKQCLGRLIRHVEAGLTLSVAWELAYRDLDAEYRKLCTSEGVPPHNHMLDGPTVELFARFGLDALFGAQRGECPEGDQRAAFWQVFRKVTQPATVRVVPVPEKTAGAIQRSAH